jgi:hypothetical protein
LSGTLNNNATHVVAVGSNANQGGVTPNQVFASCGGVNDNDNIRLTTSANALVDIWGRTDGISFTPGNQAGYTYRRITNAVAPSTTWNSADWTAIDPQDYTNVGSYVNFVNNYEYSIDGGTTYQSSPAFTAVAPGTHVLVVRDIATGCTSQPIDVFVAPTNPIPAVTTFDYGTGTFCQDAANPAPNTSATGFTTGGTFSEVNTTGLVIDPVTGQINLAASTVGSHTVRYEVAFNPVTCQSAGSTDVTIQIIQVFSMPQVKSLVIDEAIRMSANGMTNQPKELILKVFNISMIVIGIFFGFMLVHVIMSFRFLKRYQHLFMQKD